MSAKEKTRSTVIPVVVATFAALVLPLSGTALAAVDAVVATPSNASNVVGQPHAITVTATESGTPTADVPIVMTVAGPNATSSDTCTTGTDGSCVVTYTGMVAGTDTITVFADLNTNDTLDAGEPSDTATKTWVAPDDLNITVTPAAVTNQVGDVQPVTVTVADGTAAPIVGVTVDLAIHGSGDGVNGTLSASTCTTDGAGTCSVDYTGTSLGVDAVKATVAGAPAVDRSKIRTVVVPDSVVATPADASNVVGQTHFITVTAAQNGAPAANEPIVMTVAGPNATSSDTCATATDGTCVVSYTGTVAGTDTITVFADLNDNRTLDAGEQSDTVTKTYLLAADVNIGATPVRAIKHVGQSQTVTVTATDQNGSAIAHLTVDLALLGSGDGVNGTLSGSTCRTQSDGVCTVVYTGTSAGTDVVRASVAGAGVQGTSRIISVPVGAPAACSQPGAITGTNGPDTLTGTPGDDIICGFKGHDTIGGLGGKDSIFGGGGTDTIRGDRGNDTLHGGFGNDALHGGRGNDMIVSGSGNDTVNGGSGHDTIRGAAGSDKIWAGNGADHVFGGTGRDTAHGQGGNDVLKGRRGPDTLRGGRGRDRLKGDRGNDALFGGRGRDLLDGGPGFDTGKGGPGVDVRRHCEG